MPEDTPYDVKVMVWALERMRMLGIVKDQRKLIAAQIFAAGVWKGRKLAMEDYEVVMDAARKAIAGVEE